MDFTASVKSCFSRYATFAGRSPRSEYWFFGLFCFIVQAVAAIVLSESLSSLVGLGLLLPSLAVGVRRMHDIDRSGWWSLIIFIPLVGWVLWIIWCCTRGDPGSNIYGENPLPEAAPVF